MEPSLKGTLWYLGLAFGLAWISWEAPFLLGANITPRNFQLYALPGSFAPAIAAIVVRKWITREGFGDAGLKIDLRRWRYYIVAWLVPLAVILVIAAEAWIFSIASADLSAEVALKAMGRMPPAAYLPYAGYIVVVQLLVQAVLMTPVLWGEEFGWRGYLQPRLFPGKPLQASVATGIIWAIWHYPLIFRGYNYPGQPWLGIALFPVTSILLSIIFGWLRDMTGSVWAPSLAHSATNVIGGSLSLLWFYGAASPVWIGYQGVLAWLPLGAFSIWIAVAGRTKPAGSQ